MISIAERLSPYTEALSVSSFRKLLIGQSLSMAGDAICLAALPIALIRTGYGAEVFGFVMAAVGVGSVIGACRRLAGGSKVAEASTDLHRHGEGWRNWPQWRCSSPVHRGGAWSLPT
jgi:hypothetical protein